MPYIDNERKNALRISYADDHDFPDSTGELNFVISQVIARYLEGHMPLNYDRINSAIGVLECAKMEIYRRIAVPYEAGKIAQNGDVFSAKLTSSDERGLVNAPDGFSVPHFLSVHRKLRDEKLARRYKEFRSPPKSKQPKLDVRRVVELIKSGMKAEDAIEHSRIEYLKDFAPPGRSFTARAYVIRSSIVEQRSNDDIGHLDYFLNAEFFVPAATPSKLLMVILDGRKFNPDGISPRCVVHDEVGGFRIRFSEFFLKYYGNKIPEVKLELQRIETPVDTGRMG